MLKELIIKEEISEEEKEVLRKIRNSFSHNIYPDQGVVEIRTLPNIARDLIRIFGNSVAKLN